MRLVLRLRMDKPDVVEDSDTECSDPGDALEVMEAFRAEVEAIGPAVADITRRIEAVAARVTAAEAARGIAETAGVPTQEIRAWCETHGLGHTVTPRDLFRTILETAVTTDLAARTIRLAPETAAALGFPEVVSVFALIRGLPRLLV
jgi:hypothetical protein